MMMMPSCREVSRAVASGELERLGFWKRLGARLHLRMCRHCRRYARQIRAIGEATRALFEEAAEDQAIVDRLRKAILRGHGADH